MANRYFNQFRLSLEKQVVDIFAQVTFGAAGAPTLSGVNSKGVVSCTRNSTGTYTFVFGTTAGYLDTYNRLLCVDVVFDETSNSGTAPLSPGLFVKSNLIATSGTASVQIVLLNGSLAATDPASTEIGLFNFTFKNSNAP